jgi:hypothetical protein
VHNDTSSGIDKSELRSTRWENLAQAALIDSPSNWPNGIHIVSTLSVQKGIASDKSHLVVLPNCLHSLSCGCTIAPLYLRERKGTTSTSKIPVSYLGLSSTNIVLRTPSNDHGDKVRS